MSGEKNNRICARCGKSFFGGSGERFCKSCTVALLRGGTEKIQQSIKNFVRDNQGVTEHEIIKKFGVTKKFLNQMTSQKIISSAGEIKVSYPCENCGKIITEGVYCQECFLLLRKEVKRRSERMFYLQGLFSKNDLAKKYDATILIVEHDELSLNVFKFILEKGLPTYKISVAGNFGGALNVINNQDVGLILLDDTVTNNFDGMAILKKFREDSKTKNIPIVMLTNFADREKISKGLTRGASDYITIPCEPGNLIERVKKNIGIEVENISEVEGEKVEFENTPQYKIFVVEDKSKDFAMEKSILEDKFPCEIISAPNGIEALHKLSDPTFDADIVLVNMEMPFMDGFEFLAFVKEDDKMRKFPVIIMTTSTDVNVLSGIKKSFAKGYIRKPEFSLQDLALIEKILTSK